MKKLWFVVCLLLLPTILYASPFLICDPQVGITHYVLTGDKPWVPSTSLAIADGSIKLDVASAVVGVTNMTVKACITDAVWGDRCSTTVPFILSRPGLPVVPVLPRLVP
jgi:hypothetical protein